jgi:small-conductance mechanosensitive channel
MVDAGLVEAPLQVIDTVLILRSILIILLAYLLARAIAYLLTRISERAAEYRITVKMVIPLLKFTIYGIALYYVLRPLLSLSSTQLVAFSGLLGAAIGFGLKDLFADVIGGLFLVFEKPYQIGDKVRIGGYYGEVSDIGIRSTRLVTPDDNLVSVPNYLMFTQAVASANAGSPQMMVVIDLFVGPESDAEVALQILEEAVVTSKYVYISKKRPFTLLLDDSPFYRRLRAKAYVYDLRYEFEFKSEVTRRAWQELTKRGIKAPKVPVMGEKLTVTEKEAG